MATDCCGGGLKSKIFKTFPLEETRKAHELIDSRVHIGKIVLTTRAYHAA
ncbi:zinc-binding dehydrogenase [Pectobacterium aquaticum]|nr:zinc-binding dehydrogenase [Pectobacterium aquaticum]UEM37974.1 zinc-binding dehydrogenase [Pectobacterium aquaticum]